MGVHGLWDLLAPVGRRVSVETLAGKRLAIDASIWMIQFMKAMRDEKGEMLRNAHLLGFFRRICKLLFLRTKPVFVFDGATPALKRRTVIARRRQRENAQAKIRKTAEKMLLNHVKAMRLKMLAADIKEQRVHNNSNGKEVVGDQSNLSSKNDAASEVHRQEIIDEMLVASISAEEGHSLYGNASSSAVATGSDIDNVSASATTSQNLRGVAGDLEDQSTKSNAKGKEVMIDQSNMFGKDGGGLEGSHQEMIDEMLAASILAEDCAGLDGNDSGSMATGTDRHNASTSAAAFSAEYENEDSDEEMILPVSDRNVDPAVLAALPPSMQLDLLVQMRERLMAENRQRYQKVKKAPQKFSELQIEAYLKTVAFRREIDEVQRAASGRGVAGVQTSRIASEANREFIFSSSFSGDKQLLTSNQADKDGEKLQNMEKKDSYLEVQNAIASATKFNRGAEPTSNSMGTIEDLVNDVQTFLDERGHMRVSRRRAMGIRMTRDLERNLDLLKEFELDITSANNLGPVTTTMDGRESISGKPHDETQSFEDIDVVNVETMPSVSENSLLEAENSQRELSHKSSCLKISFDDNGENKSLDDEDELFARLVAGESVGLSSAGKSVSDCTLQEGNTAMDCGHSTKSMAENGDGNESDLEWEEAVIGKGNNLTDQNEFETNISYVEGKNNSSDVEWEEGTSLVIVDKKSEIEAFNEEDLLENEAGVKCSGGTSDFHKDASEVSANIPNTISKGSAEEETALQEAIRRSLEDFTKGKDSKIFHLEKCCNIRNSPESHLKVGNALPNDKPSQSFVDVNGSEAERDASASPSPPFSHSSSDAADSDVASEKVAVSSGTKETSQIGNLTTNACSAPKHIPDVFTTNSLQEGALICSSTAVADVAMGQSGSVAEHIFCTEAEKSITKENIAPIRPIDVQKSGNAVETSMSKHKDKDDTKDNVASIDVQQSGNAAEPSMFKHKDTTNDFVGASLEDELSVLSREYENLGDEQRKLERNADSVNTEMFVECQELLQMFGLPYIIAPMEAEAQCAYMELMNLVDGVVTDDSDVFLFGARSVYKNIFDDRKYVETYFMKDIESELGLSREKLIRMAMLLGSDYTEGISGIGIVNAIEVVNAFPEEDGLHKFREWIESPDPTILGKVGVQSGSSSNKRQSKASKGNKGGFKNNLAGNTSDCDALHENDENIAADDTTDIKQIFMEKHRNVSKNWHIPDSFPSDAVIHAYNSPQVDRSTELFAWGKPDIFALRRMCWEKFGWASQKADELLRPVLNEYNKHETQLRLEAFYTFNERFAKIRSKRIKQAVKGITGKQSLESVEIDDLQKTAGATGKGKVRARKNSQRKNGNPMGSLLSEEGSKGLSSEADERRLNVAGGSKVRGNQRQKSTRRGRKMENPDLTDDETNSHNSDSSRDEYKNEMQAENVEFPANVRRSKRARKAASYVEKDEENEHIDSLNISDHERSKEGAKRKRSHNQRISNDDVPDFSQARGSTCQDPLVEDSEAGNYLVVGGGFYANNDKGETENDALTKAPDMEYLQSGGGFCVNEDEEDQHMHEQNESTTAEITARISTPLNEAGEMEHEIDQCELVISQASVSDTALGSNACPQSDFNVSGDKHETTHQNLSNVVENVKDDALSSVNAFSAIPYLKRKRRKT